MMPPAYIFVMGENTKNANISGFQEIKTVKVLNPPQIQHLTAIHLKFLRTIRSPGAHAVKHPAVISLLQLMLQNPGCFSFLSRLDAVDAAEEIY